ncbi:MAG: ribose-phosphate diphosphokinase [Kouleothrix sp.]
MVGDVEGRTAIIIDDMISTGGTLAEAARALKERGALEVHACATHGIFAGDAIGIIAASMLVETVVTNTIPLPANCDGARIRVMSVAPLFAEAIMRIHKDLSLSARCFRRVSGLRLHNHPTHARSGAEGEGRSHWNAIDRSRRVWACGSFVRVCRAAAVARSAHNRTHTRWSSALPQADIARDAGERVTPVIKESP